MIVNTENCSVILATKQEFLFGMDRMLVALAAVSVAISSPHPSPDPRARLFQKDSTKKKRAVRKQKNAFFGSRLSRFFFVGAQFFALRPN